MLGHLIEIHYMDGRVEKKKGWHSTKAISELWVDDVVIHGHTILGHIIWSALRDPCLAIGSVI